MSLELSDIAEWALQCTEDDINFLQKIINVRRDSFREARALVNAQEMYVGDSVRLIPSIRPKKIANKTGKIIAITEKGQFKVELDFPPDMNWLSPNCDPSHIEKI